MPEVCSFSRAAFTLWTLCGRTMDLISCTSVPPEPGAGSQSRPVAAAATASRRFSSDETRRWRGALRCQSARGRRRTLPQTWRGDRAARLRHRAADAVEQAERVLGDDLDDGVAARRLVIAVNHRGKPRQPPP